MDDWIEWNGGSRPVGEDQVVEVKFRNGETEKGFVDSLFWTHYADGDDIVAYRVVGEDKEEESGDSVNHPPHYTGHPSGVECIQITEHMGFNLGNAVKYIWRADLKGNAIEDLEKAEWYIEREILKRTRGMK